MSRARNGVAWIGVGLALAAVAGAACAAAARRPVVAAPVRDYSGRSGFPAPPEAMRGRARDAFFADGARATPAHLPDPPP